MQVLRYATHLCISKHIFSSSRGVSHFLGVSRGDPEASPGASQGNWYSLTARHGVP